MVTGIPGLRVGHASDAGQTTGCTVILCPEGTVGGAEVRGPAPGTREVALLASEKTVSEVHAVLLSGGSAFGLAAADGVMRYLEEQGIGYFTPAARVPIVPAAVVYDLRPGNESRLPDAEMGYAACQNARADAAPQGNVGAGTGVTVGKWAGGQGMMKGGFGVAEMEERTAEDGESLPLKVAAAAVTNGVGDVLAADGTILAGARAPDGSWLATRDPLRRFPAMPGTPGTNTTLVVVVTNARLDKIGANRLAQRAQDGMALAIQPVHTSYDGDTAFALATGQVEAPFDLVANMAVAVVAAAIRNAVRAAATGGSIVGLAT